VSAGHVAVLDARPALRLVSTTTGDVVACTTCRAVVPVDESGMADLAQMLHAADCPLEWTFAAARRRGFPFVGRAASRRPWQES
jgi:hypothetical protein